MENSTEIINQGRPVYFSYARNSKKKPEWEHISDSVETLLETMTAKNLEYRVDVRDIGTGDKISKFEQEIGWKSEVVVIIFSDKYFRSMHCMYEFVQIKNALKQYPDKRLMCIKSGDFNLADINYIMELEDYWIDQKKEYEKIEYHRLRNHSGTEKSAWQNGFYLEDIRNLYSFFSEINYSNAATINYENFVGDIVKYYKPTPKPDRTPKPQKNSPQTQPPTRTVNTQTQTDQTPTHAVYTPTDTVPTPTNIAQPQPKPLSVQQPVSTSQPIAKKSPLKFIIIGIVGGVVFILLFCNILCNAIENHERKINFENNLKAAENGDVEAQYLVGLHYAVCEDYEKMFYWYQKAAENGNVTAQYELGCCYAWSYGGSQDSEKAVYWWQKAAENGYVKAQYELGRYYADDFGNAQDYEKAVYWYEKAAENGDVEAQYELGLCYKSGKGVEKNISKAKELLQKAAAQGYEDAIEVLKKM